MSVHSRQDTRPTARDLLRLARRKQAGRKRVRRQLAVGLGVLAVLAVLAGAGFAVGKALEDEHWEAAAKQELVKPRNASGKDGLTVLLGDQDAPATVELYEDPRCPRCAAFEQGAGGELRKGMAEGSYNVAFHGAVFLDDNGGEGSRRALSALGAALDVSPEAFLGFKSALYSDQFHPDDGTDPFADTAYLQRIADTVPELRGDKGFAHDLREGTFDRWALEHAKIFEKRGIGSTPTLRIDGKALYEEDTGRVPMTAASLRTTLAKALKH